MVWLLVETRKGEEIKDGGKEIVTRGDGTT